MNSLLEQGIIAPSSSAYGSACFVKEKHDGSGRQLIDYSELNAITQEAQFHFPSVKDTLHNMAGCKILSKLDLRKGFYQIAIHGKDHHKTAFRTPIRKFQFTRIPFGFLNAPKFFHNQIQLCLYEISGITIFVDDV